MESEDLKSIVGKEDASSEAVKQNDISALRGRIDELRDEIDILHHRLRKRKNAIITLIISLVLTLAVCIAMLVNFLSYNYKGNEQPLAANTATESISDVKETEKPIQIDTTSEEYRTNEANNGNVKQQLYLAKNYLSGTNGLKEDNKSAFRYYFMAARSGNVDALYHVGMCYMQGVGVEKNIEKAVFYLTKASEGGSEKAKSMIGSVEKDTTANSNDRRAEQ